MIQKLLIFILSVALVGVVFIVNLRSSTNTVSPTTYGLEQKGLVVDSNLKGRLLGGEHLFLRKGKRNDHGDKGEEDDRYTDRHNSGRSDKHGFPWEEEDDWSPGKKHHKKYQKGGRYVGHVDHHKRKNHDKYNDDDGDDRHYRGKRYTDDYMDDYIFDDDYRPKRKHGKSKKSKKSSYGW
jgi:hypothetical protein